MRTKLRLARDYQAPDARATVASGITPSATLKFPTRAVAAMARHARAARLARAIGRPEALPHQQLVADLEATLQHMQGRLDDLKKQVASYRFPGDELDRPRAA